MEPLHILNQTAPRDYVNFTLCFPFDDDKAQEAVKHLQRCVDDCIQQNPHLAGTLRVQHTPQRNTLAYVPAPAGDRPRVVVQQLRPSSFSSANGGSTAFTYDELRAGGFSPGLFFDDVFAPAGNPADLDEGSVPIMRVHAIFIPGGLLLGVFIHHAVADGVVATALIEHLAARTRGEKLLPRGGLLPKSQRLPLGRPSAEFEQRAGHLRENNGLSNEQIMGKMLPEWTTTDPKTGPDFSIKNRLPANKSRRVGKIFHISKTKLTKLSRALAAQGSREGEGNRKPPSTNVALMALVWAYVAKARMRAAGADSWSALLMGEMGTVDEKNMAAQLTVVAAWQPSSASSALSLKNPGGRGEGFGQETLDAVADFCGNAAMCPITALPTTQLLWRAASSRSSTTTTTTAQEENSTTEVGAKQEEALATIAASITQSLDSLNAEFVRRRAVLLEGLSDVTAMAMDHDFEAPQNVLFNSHRFLAGPDTVWDIPGLLADTCAGTNDCASAPGSSRGNISRRRSEVIRKGRKVWGQGTVLVMPSSQASDVLEVMLAMSGTAMDELCQDEGWRGWVERIVD
ncbi:hypothetical protein PG993_011229 [Apiospora rasikravindrae]|uniref:Trichothecene 3-O-acetyltransferase-like N-terminal domain-containing protein n=1 Tax=Apiospora rasikravindrae TaxID=990691 RepID=A0ABR1SF80_9PEZI